MHPDWIVPEGLPRGAVALMTTRAGGSSPAPYDSMNLGAAVGDDPQAVANNRRRLAQAIGARPVFLHQVHGARVVRLDAAVATAGAAIEADASVTDEPGLACVVLVADCLPVLLAGPGGRAVAAAHAGWRGLAAGVVEAALRELCRLADCEAREVAAWLGPCIGPSRFEVGLDVLEAFGGGKRFEPQGDKWLADLPGLARDRLTAAGVAAIHGGAWCTVSTPSRFFSFRRDRVTGRMAAAIRRVAG